MIGAHFDALGQSPDKAFDPQNFFAMRAGADDNASGTFIADPPVPKRSIMLMLNFDMIGRLSGNHLLVEGVAEHSALRLAVDRAAAATGLRADFIADRELSDHSSFAAQDIEVIALSSGGHVDYHKTTDVAARINVPGLGRVIDFAEAIVRQRDAR